MTLASTKKAKKYFAEITDLIAKMPALGIPGAAVQSQEWLGDIHELVKASGDLKDAEDLKTHIETLIEYTNTSTSSQSIRDKAVGKIQAIIHRARAALKLKASDLD